MTGSALALILIAAVFHAVWNVAAKRMQGDGYVFVWWYNAFSALLWMPIGIIVLAHAGWPWSWGLLVGPLVSAVLHIGYALTLQTGYERADLSVVYPVARGTGPLLTMAYALLVLGERPGWSAAVGGLMVIAGVAVVATGRAAGRRERAVAGLRYGAATGLMIAAYTLWDNHSVTSLALAPISYFSLGSLWQTLILTPGVRSRAAHTVAVLLRWWREVAIVAVLSPAAYILVLQAMRTTPVALVAPVRESSIVIGALLAWWLFKEPRPLRKLVGAVVVLAGIALIATA